MMSPGVRKHVLIVHVLYSVGWTGAVAAFLALAIMGFTTSDSRLVGGIYASLRGLVWYVIVPLSVLSLVTGVVQALGTPWGLFRHYWVVAKLLLTIGATVLLLVHTQVVDRAATDALTAGVTGGAGIDAVRLQLIVDAAAALIVLVLITVLAIVKPRGRTPFRSGGA